MKTLKLTLAILCYSSLTMAESQFNQQHKVNNSYTKTMAKSKSKKGSHGSSYVKIKNKQELKEALKSGKLNQTYEERGVKYIYIESKRAIHLTQRDLKDLDEINIGSNIKGDGKVTQSVHIKGLKLDTDKPINIGVNITENRRGSVTSVTNIENSQLGR